MPAPISLSKRVATTLDALARCAARLCRATIVLIIRESGGEHRLLAHHGLADPNTSAILDLAKRLDAGAHPDLLGDADSDHAIRSSVVVALTGADHTVGKLCVFRRETGPLALDQQQALADLGAAVGEWLHIAMPEEHLPLSAPAASDPTETTIDLKLFAVEEEPWPPPDPEAGTKSLTKAQNDQNWQHAVGTWEWDITKGELNWDQGTALLMGATTAEPLRGMLQWLQLIHPEDRESVRHSLEAALAGTALDWAIEFRTATFRPKYLLTDSRIHRDIDGQPVVMTGVLWDITEQRLLTEQLRKQAAILRWQLDLGSAITRAQHAFIHESEPDRAYEILLEDLLALTGSAYGFVAEIRHAVGSRIPRVRASTNIAWEESCRCMRVVADQSATPAEDLVAALMQRVEPLIHNEVDDRPHCSLPPGHARLRNFLGIPVFDPAGVVAAVGLANRPDGFEPALVEQLQPLLATIGQFVRAESESLARREGQQRLAATIEAARVGTWDWNIQTGELVINERWAAMLGYTLADLHPINIGSWYYLGHPQDLERAHRLLLANFCRDLDYFDVEIRMRHQAGHWVWVHSRGRIASWDHTGRPLKMYGTHTDITERKQAESSLYRSEARLRALFELSPAGIALLDATTQQILDANPAMLRMLGLEADDDLHLLTASLLSPADQAKCIPLIPGQDQTQFERIEKELYRRDGSPVPVRIQARSFRDDTGGHLIWSTIEDLSDSHRIHRMKREFVSVVSHELRTPLTALRGALGLLGRLQGTKNGPATELLEIAGQNCLRLGYLVDDLLDMERLSAGKLRLTLSDIPVTALLAEASSSHRTYLPDHRSKLRVIEPSTDATVRADRQRLIQILSNLLSNALKFSPPDTMVELGADTVDDWVRFWVQDQGPGIPEEFHDHIFQRFSQVDASDARQIGGSGLGLAIVRELTQLMNGRVGFVSKPGSGARFWVELPTATGGHV
jgi:PAS domain S-box-containing protein